MSKWHSVNIVGTGDLDHRIYRYYVDGQDVNGGLFDKMFPDVPIPECKRGEECFYVRIGEDDKIAIAAVPQNETKRADC